MFSVLSVFIYDLIMSVPPTLQSWHEGLKQLTDIKMLPKIQRIYKYKIVFLNCDRTTFYQSIPDNYFFAQFGNSKVNIQKGKEGLILKNTCGFLFSAYLT